MDEKSEGSATNRNPRMPKFIAGLGVLRERGRFEATYVKAESERDSYSKSRVKSSHESRYIVHTKLFLWEYGLT